MTDMITVAEAKDIIRQAITLPVPVSVPLNKAALLVLAEDAMAPFDIPAFRQSAVDGYAFNYTAWQQEQSLIIVAEIAAGNEQSINISANEAARIFTGAPVPAGADTVVMQEKTTVKRTPLQVQDAAVVRGSNVRSRGSELQAGDIALPKGSLLVPGAVGLLAAAGIAEVSIYPAPIISLIITGNELQQPGNNLLPGQVYESNSFALIAALTQLPVQPAQVLYAKDDLAALQNTLEQALAVSDLVLLTGGVSVGDYDFVTQAAARCGIRQQFHKIRQKPGKPLYFGTKGRQLIFGLPGNPSSVLTCFYEYVIPAIEQLVGKPGSFITKKYLPLAHAYDKKEGLTHFLKGYCTAESVTALDAQESYRMRSFAVANCLICLEAEQTHINQGDIVEIHLLPSY
ncbi:MAG: hypothetical protein NVSMB63_09650 [Sediminibacterium sp.]